MLKLGLLLAILIFTIIHVTFGGITETKGSVFVFRIFSQFCQIFLWQEKLTPTSKAEQLTKRPNCQVPNDLF